MPPAPSLVSMAMLFLSGRLASSLPFLPRSTSMSTRRALSSLSASASAFPGTYYVTTPIYYVNDKPHIGHAYTSTAADVLARYKRLQGLDVHFLTGTDEHGLKVQNSAVAAGVNPQEFVDGVSRNFREMCDLLDVSQDYFVRTTDAGHKEAAGELWRRLVERDAIYLGAYEGWYSVRDECYYTENELVDGKAPTGAEVVWMAKEESYFFKLSEYQDRLLEHLENNPDFVAPRSRLNEVTSFLKGGLRDLSISRTTFDWGVPVPDNPDHVMYVWIDALANYLSAINYPWKEGDDHKGKYWPADVHLVGKDILRFHAIYWPAMLMAADLPLPKRIFAHGWWTKDGQKISKSVGNVVDPLKVVEKYGVDQTRFFLMSEVSFGSDGDFSDDAMIITCNTCLANELGNLCQRTLSMVFKNCEKAIPVSLSPYTTEDKALLAVAAALPAATAAHVDVQALHRYCEELIETVRAANRYIDEQAPWALKKTDPERMVTVLYVVMEVLRHVAVMYQPVIPTSAGKILDQLGVPEEERTFAALGERSLRLGTPISKPQGVFPRIEAEVQVEL